MHNPEAKVQNTQSQPWKIVGDFELYDVIGKGAFGEVFLARRTSDPHK